jgi:DNA-binding beta-propeller fold protein YncE
MYKTAALGLILACAFQPGALGQTGFVNWENPHVSPLAMTPDGTRLLAVDTADNRLLIFDITTATAVPLGEIPVGLDPVSVRARSNTQAWVVNHISDSISVVDLTAGNVITTLATADEPADVVFAGSPQRAFVSCSQANQVMVFDPADLSAAPVTLDIAGEDPRAMAVSPDGGTVYVAVFESGNATTILGGGGTIGGGFPPNAASDPAGPYGGVNPPPNDGAGFNPPQNGANPAPPAVGLIVRKDENGEWMDDNGGDWSSLVSGNNAALSGRPEGWDLPDNDLAIIDAATLSVTYASRLMNICMAVAVNPASGAISVVGTEAINEIRYEPILSGRFTRVNIALVDGGDPLNKDIVDLNPHLDYSSSTIGQGLRDQSLGDPRGIAWNAAGTRAYVTGMGSNNLVVIDSAGARAGLQPAIEVGQGPTGVALDEARSRLYVLNKFEAAISVVDTASELELQRVAFFDPTTTAIKLGRRHLYDTHETSGLGHIACASCHVDARFDRLAWDLGDPAGTVKPFNQNCNNGVAGGCQGWHPMKGPMTTQTLQDIIGKEPHHWRGDRNGLEEFNPAFEGLLGDDEQLSAAEMQEYENFLASITFPPNPFRNLNNTLPTALSLEGHFTTGRFAPAGQPLGTGNAVNGLSLYRTAGLDAVECVSCHTLPSGVGSNYTLSGLQFVPIPAGPNGELHHSIVSVDGSTNVSIKVPQLRNLYDKVGFETTQVSNLAGFGFLHDGSVDSIARFVSEPVFSVGSDQQVADLVAFMLSFAGSELPLGSPTNPTELPGPSSKDSHAAVGRQTTIVDAQTASFDQLALIANLQNLANSNKIGLVVKGVQGGLARGYSFVPGGTFQSDRAAETLTFAVLLNAAEPGSELTWTAVPKGTEVRIGIDRDKDGHFDRDEIDGCSDPADAASVPPQCAVECVAAADCADVDDNGVRDDNCVWWACATGACQGTDIPFADMGGAFGACPPDGVADANDRFHALNCFSDLDSSGTPGYPCEPSPPVAFNVDAGGSFGDCAPDGVCDGNDAFHALNAFSGTTACSCPGGPGPDHHGKPQRSGPVVVERAGLQLEAAQKSLRPGGIVAVTVRLHEGLDDLRGYQLHVAASGGRSGALELVDIVLGDQTVFTESEDAKLRNGQPGAEGLEPRSRGTEPGAGNPDAGLWSAFNVRTGQMVAGVDGAGIAAAAGAELATFVFQASADAAGQFSVVLLHDDSDPNQRTFLFPTRADGKIEITSADAVVIDVQPDQRAERK